jgi:hypothetical protein
MGEKRFRTRAQWHHTRLAVYAAPFFLLGGVLVGVATGRYDVLLLMGSLVGFAFVVGVLRDRTGRGNYHISGETLTLSRGNDQLTIAAGEILDASLMDRAGARHYFQSRLLRPSMSRIEAGREFLRFCTVDIGLRTFTFGLGRGLIDRMPDARHDMLLLRLKQGSDLLLSPEYNQDMVESIARMLRRSTDRSAETPKQAQ